MHISKKVEGYRHEENCKPENSAKYGDGKTLKVGDGPVTYTIAPKNTKACGSYTVSFKGSAVVNYVKEIAPEKSGTLGDISYTQISVKPTKKGKLTIYCVPNDGSGKKFSFEIDVLDKDE